MLNKVELIGYVGSNPIVKEFENGKVVNISLATSETYKDKNGEKVTNTEWHNVDFFGKLADIAEKYISKGKLLFISGKIKTTKYNKENVECKYTKIIAQNFMFLNSGNNEDIKSETKSEKESTNDLPF